MSASERNPSEAYPQQHYGNHPGRFEVDRRVWRLETPIPLLQYAGGLAPIADVATRVTVTAYKPDVRTILRLSVGFRADDVLDLDNVTPNGLTVRANLARSLVWLSECDDFGGGLTECGDLVGTEAAPVQFIADGNWGAIWEVDVDCKAVRARFDFRSLAEPGRFFCNAKWVARGWMSDADWMAARERMQVVRQPQSLVLSCNLVDEAG